MQLSSKPVYFHALSHKALYCSLIILYLNIFLKVLGTSYFGHHKISAKYTIKLTNFVTMKIFLSQTFFFLLSYALKKCGIKLISHARAA